MLDQDEPTFANWDQDEAALAARYDLQDPAVVGPSWLRPPRRSRRGTTRSARRPRRPGPAGGLRKKAASSRSIHRPLPPPHVLHHTHEVRGRPRRHRRAYDGNAPDYSDGTWALTTRCGRARRVRRRGRRRGSGCSRSAAPVGATPLALEARGLPCGAPTSPGVRRAAARRGHAAEVLDPLTDDLADPATRAVRRGLGQRRLLHVARPDLPAVLRRLAGDPARGRPGMSLKEGDGEGWSTHGHVRAPRRFVYWREEPLREVLEEAGWRVRPARPRHRHHGADLAHGPRVAQHRLTPSALILFEVKSFT